jgi:hypothetical protein
VRDLYLLWIQGKEKDQIDQIPLSPNLSFVFLFIGGFILKTSVTIGDLIRYESQLKTCRWTCGSEELPYFGKVSIENFRVSNACGYDPIPSLKVLQNEIQIVSNHLYDAGLNIRYSLNHPILVYRLFKDLKLPVELYAYYKIISRILGTDVVQNGNISKCFLHVSSCVLWIALAFYPPAPLLPLIQIPSYLFTQSQELEFTFLSNEMGIIEQKKVGVSKIAASLFNQSISALEGDSTIPPPSVTILDDLVKVLCPSRFPHNSHHFNTYIGSDLDGAKSPLYTFLLLHIAHLVGMDPYKIHSEYLNLSKILLVQYVQAQSESLP